MPREIITVANDFQVEIGWKRGMYAQLGVRSVNGKTLEQVVAEGNGEDFDSLWATLNVEGIDNLIKVLRRVKRQLVLAPDVRADDKHKPLVSHGA